MSDARGDSKPCTRTGCAGTMQFGRAPLPRGPSMRPADGERGWVCSEKAEHFQRPSERSAPALVTRSVAQASWDDDGGAGKQSLPA
jgi:hypothetical protein